MAMSKGKRIKRINNLVIYETPQGIHSYSVWNLEGTICFEDRLSLEQAKKFCKDTEDFIKNKKGQ